MARFNVMRPAIAAGAAWMLAGSAAFAAAGADLAPIQPGLDYHSFANIESSGSPASS